MILEYQVTLAKARALLDKHGLKDWRVRLENLNNGLYNPEGGCHAFGICFNYRKLIVLDHRVCSPRHFRQTVLHEIAHALVLEPPIGQPCHTPEWAAKARELGCTQREIRDSIFIETVLREKNPPPDVTAIERTKKFW